MVTEKLCACGCRTVIADDKTYVRGHNSRGNTNPMKNPEIAKKNGISKRGIEKTPQTKEKLSIAVRKTTQTSEYREKQSDILKKIWTDPEYRKMQSDAHTGFKVSEETKQKERIALDTHHYIYDYSDWNKYTIKVSKSEHATIHHNLRRAGLEVPCINIMVGE